MLSVSPQMITNFSWPYDQENMKSQQQQQQQQQYNNNLLFADHETDTSGSGLGSPTSRPQVLGIIHNIKIDSNNNDDDGTIILVKKLNHNASERDRRKRINELYSSLRALLPATDHKKKLSIPATISRVVKYIPEVQEEVERMVQKKEVLINVKIGIRKEGSSYGNRRSESSSSSVVSASRFGERDIVIQISMLKTSQGSSIAEALLILELEALFLLNMSSFESFEGRVFYNLHLQVLQGTQVMDLERLREKLLSLYKDT